MRVVIILVTLLTIASCNELKEGNVINKRVDPERDYLYMMPIPHTIYNGKTSTTTYTYVPIWMHDDEDYIIEIHGTTSSGKEKNENFYVSKDRFDKISIGQFICIDEGCRRSPNKDTKK